MEGKPLTAKRAAEIIPGLTEDQFSQIIGQLQRRYREQGRPYGFVRQGEGYLLTLRPQYRFLIEKLYGERKETTLSLAAIEVLAIVAYRQPVSRGTIDALRGRDSTAVIRQLLRRGLIAVHTGEPPPTAPSTEPQSSSHTQAEAMAASGPATLPEDRAPIPDNSGTDNAAQATAASRQARREAHYITTPRFLALFGLRDLSDLPRTDDLQVL
ncbi:Segregation and condensation protein B [bacterium HR36]|nr:Segregation and condensation protein B [bacterium HR36]